MLYPKLTTLLQQCGFILRFQRESSRFIEEDAGSPYQRLQVKKFQSLIGITSDFHCWYLQPLHYLVFKVLFRQPRGNGSFERSRYQD
ncbi:hypothetical protein BLD44_000430 [Mastigocladus laminosus UU774]|nr:hypothetical protein BLD44_000430 [Mastigocladus laminosus UU774]